MFDTFVHHPFLWLTGLGSVTTVILLAVLAPSVLAVLAEFFKPVAAALGQWFALWLSDLATGLRLMLSSVAGIIFCLSLFGAGVLGGHWYWKNDDGLTQLHKYFVCYPRKAVHKYVYHWYDPVTWF